MYFHKQCFSFLTVLALLASLGITVAAPGQIANPTLVAPGVRSADVIVDSQNELSIYNVRSVQRTLEAVSYFPNFGPTSIHFAGTDMAHGVVGHARIYALPGETNVSVQFEHLTPANGFGAQFLTYVLWAVSADGRAQNLGELELAGTKASLKVTTALQSFGLIVTAEPYFAVAQPSDVVIAQSVSTKQTSGVLQSVNTHYSLLPRGLYANTFGAQTVANPITDREHTPLALFEAVNAQQISSKAGADQYSPDIMAEVAQDITNAQQIQANKHRDLKLELSFARQAVQRSEDARISTLHKQAAERQRLALQQATDAQAQADAARLAELQAAQERDQAELTAARAQADADKANQNASATLQDVAAQRERLRAQLNAILETSETARGLIVNLNDVLFATGKATLKVNAQISLAKVATIVSLYPGLKLHVEGYTDTQGGVALNQRLSNTRANSVADFLTHNGVPSDNVTAQGFGESNPVDTNATSLGRAKNRRVNLVVSGSAIGVDGTPKSVASN